MIELPRELDVLLEQARTGRVVVLTGAGVSEESGIPTFRGPEGYWTCGAREYQPEEIATQAFFRRQPEAVWAWYLYRRGVCRAARPNAAHHALADLERCLGDRCVLVTQNVDGLHLRAGSSAERTWQIHGNLHFMRCSVECSDTLWSVPGEIGAWERGRQLGEPERQCLRCPRCRAWARPHVLWFDETYDEARYRFESSLRAVSAASLLLVVGTSAATSLPMHMGVLALRAGVPIVDVNPESNPFSEFASRQPNGVALTGRATEVLPELVSRLVRHAGGGSR